MRLYLDSNVARFFRPLAKSKEFKVTHYVDGLTDTICDQIVKWQKLLQDRLGADGKSRVEEARQMIEDTHSETDCKWEGYHCFIGIRNNHAVLYFIPIESRETPYNTSGWHEYNSSFEVDILRIHLAYSENDERRYAVYIDTLKRQVENVRLFLCCNIFTSPKALEMLAYITALQLWNYGELESDCLEFAKAVAKSAKQYFATERELAKSKTKLEVQVVVDIDNLTVTNFKSEALSRRNPASRFAVLISMGWIQPLQTVFITVLVNMIFHHFFKR
ncbi:PREDICTED: uncharacterized protein LOC107352024 [Acropora digitifera]|uniref:uncharacterized protein LOC107352024 n=1 Tax=Acropora digitifera TaxID=70779 RepID=UPI00077A2B0F|nr:PREDICTED: uncharacterized protein LOC107352024 [Acropora digitifera]